MLTDGLSSVVELPALSITVTDCLSPTPSFVKANGLVALVDASPDMSSLAVNATSTSELFQPLAFAAGAGAPNASEGAVASRLSVTVPEPVPPAEVAVQVNVTPAVSWVTAVASQPCLLVTGVSASVT